MTSETMERRKTYGSGKHVQRERTVVMAVLGERTELGKQEQGDN